MSEPTPTRYDSLGNEPDPPESPIRKPVNTSRGSFFNFKRPPQFYSSTRKSEQCLDNTYELVGPNVTASSASSGDAVKSANGKRIGKLILTHVGALLPLMLLIVAEVAIIKLGIVRDWSQDINMCDPAGNFASLPTVRPIMGSYQRFNPWKASGLLSITLGFGKLQFEIAKLRDVVWDNVVGRGGQAFMAVVTYKVFTKALLRSMESGSVSPDTFEALTFQHYSAWSLYRLVRDIGSDRGFRAKIAMLWIILTLIYALALPTLVSAMTGYATNVETFITLSDKKMAPWEAFEPVQFMVHDGWRVNLTGGFILTHRPVNMTGLAESPGISIPANVTDIKTVRTKTEDSVERAGHDACIFNRNTSWHMPQNCTLIWHVAQYVNTYGLDPSDTKSTFNLSGKTIELPAPTLNISAWSMSASYVYLSNYQGEPSSGSSPVSSTSWRDTPLWAYNNETFDTSAIDANGSCQQASGQPTYKWGFSFLLLFTTCLLTFVWAMGMYAIWLDAYFHSRFDSAHHNMGNLRAALDFAAAIRKDMGEEASEELSNRQLEQHVKRALHGGRIGYDVLDPEKVPLTRAQELAIWLDRRDWGRGLKRRRVRFFSIGVVLVLVVVVVPLAVTIGNYSYHSDFVYYC